MFLTQNDMRTRDPSLLPEAWRSASPAPKLVYVSTAEPGLVRVKRRQKFIYLDGRRVVRDTETLIRIKKLAIPPAWEDVWICRSDEGHLQATGIDQKKRKQYRYHSLWSAYRTENRFDNLYAFGLVLPKIRAAVKRDLAQKELTRRKVLALIVYLMEITSIRVGNSVYEKTYGSYGLTTLKDRHVKFGRNEMKFIFRGKKGIAHNISVKNKKVAALVRKCRDIPGVELFQYPDENGEYRKVDSGAVNDYIREVSGGEFTAKDFRTWAGTVYGIRELRKHAPPESEADAKRKIVAALDSVCIRLGNTRSVCRKHYVHPILFRLFEEGDLAEKNSTGKEGAEDLNSDEKLLMKILRRNRRSLAKRKRG